MMSSPRCRFVCHCLIFFRLHPWFILPCGALERRCFLTAQGNQFSKQQCQYWYCFLSNVPMQWNCTYGVNAWPTGGVNIPAFDWLRFQRGRGCIGLTDSQDGVKPCQTSALSYCGKQILGLKEFICVFDVQHSFTVTKINIFKVLKRNHILYKCIDMFL